jgi:GNAT superfamily N-acetyltransferase
VSFCRVVTDSATFAWLCDVFVDEAYRGRKLGEAMVEAVVGLPELQGVRLVLATQDAQRLYAKYGFEALPPGRTWMTRSARAE